MSQSPGPAQHVTLADLLSQDSMDVVDLAHVLQEAPLKDILSWQHESQMTRLGGDRDDGYYGWKTNREQVLEKDNDTRLQSNVQKVADRYISANGWDPVYGTPNRDKPRNRGET